MGYGKHNRSKGGNSSRGRTDNLAREDESLPLDQGTEKLDFYVVWWLCDLL
jgi:pre-rRNA-processing protein TSR3